MFVVVRSRRFRTLGCHYKSIPRIVQPICISSANDIRANAYTQFPKITPIMITE